MPITAVLPALEVPLWDSILNHIFLLSNWADGFAYRRNYQDRPVFHDEVLERQLGGEPSDLLYEQQQQQKR